MPGAMFCWEGLEKQRRRSDRVRETIRETSLSKETVVLEDKSIESLSMRMKEMN